MAMNEALLIAQGKTLEINTELLPLFPSRTREAIKGQRRQQKYKDLVAEYVQSNSLSLTSTGISSTVLPAAPSVNTCLSRSSSLDATSSHVKDGALVNRPVTRRQKRLAKANVQEPQIPPDPPDPPPDDLLTSSDSSSNNDLNNSDLILSFRDDFDPDYDDNLAVSSGTIADPSTDVLQAVRDVRDEIEAANTSLLEFSVNESLRLETTTVPEAAFSLNETDSRIIDYLDLLFRSDQSSVLSVELGEAWDDFRRKRENPVHQNLFNFRSVTTG
ncbi:hypothetical protein AVEN_215961-1 [Araneus ventricosus]|uniref:Uncharacterized protein n=1 Tax=Araneus ventricosus TaxID=182803 RepID=A0A4Y2L590_ARAVE|nr:hypothetical protein AVEN_215961-1 [Araneus ventricosus]